MASLYHYTSVESFHKMMTSSLNQPTISHNRKLGMPYYQQNSITLHLSHIRYLNDDLEYRYFKSILWNAIHNKKETITYEQFLEFVKIADIFEAPFVLSFSKANDYLPMWQMYGNNAEGVMLEFDEDLLNEEGDKRYQLNKVTYAETLEDEEIIDKCIKSIESKRSDLHDLLRVSDIGIIQQSPLFKSSDYAYEQAYRMSKKTNLVYTKVSRGILKLYTDIAIPANYLSSVTLGPCLRYKDDQKKAMEYLLNTKMGIGDCSVKFSKVNGYRSI